MKMKMKPSRFGFGPCRQGQQRANDDEGEIEALNKGPRLLSAFWKDGEKADSSYSSYWDVEDEVYRNRFGNRTGFGLSKVRGVVYRKQVLVVMMRVLSFLSVLGYFFLPR